MATGTYSPDPFFQFFDDDGNPLDGGFLYTYQAGTTTPLATYSNVGLTATNPNPVPLDGGGRCTLFLSPTSYKFVLKDSSGTTIATRDNVGAVPTTSIDNDVIGTAGEDLVANQVVYLGAGSWSKADADAAATSTTPGEIAFVVADVDNGESGTFRKSGRMTGFTGLTPGSKYYISATAGEITATAPANDRYVGEADSITSLIISPSSPVSVASVTAIIDPRIKTLCNGRLTLTTNVPVTTTDVTAATTLYWSPYLGNALALYSGSAWVAFAQAQLSIAVPATTAQMYDVFVDYNSGTPALSLLAWTNDTTRATALTTQDGVLVLTGATTKRYVGSFRTTGVSGQTEDSVTKRYVYNHYNRVDRPLRRVESTASWTYSTASIRQANGAAANQVEVVTGVSEEVVNLTVSGLASNTGGGLNVMVGIGENSTTAVATGFTGGGGVVAATGAFATMAGALIKPTAVGYAYYAWLEKPSGTTADTVWYGAAIVTGGGANGLNGSVRQ